MWQAGRQATHAEQQIVACRGVAQRITTQHSKTHDTRISMLQTSPGTPKARHTHTHTKHPARHMHLEPFTHCCPPLQQHARSSTEVNHTIHHFLSWSPSSKQNEEEAAHAAWAQLRAQAQASSATVQWLRDMIRSVRTGTPQPTSPSFVSRIGGGYRNTGQQSHLHMWR